MSMSWPGPVLATPTFSFSTLLLGALTAQGGAGTILHLVQRLIMGS